MSFSPETSAARPLPGFEGIFRYFDPREQKTMVKILPGEYYLTGSREEVIVTTLGSCISVCIRDAEAALGGMNHFMLPGTSSRNEGLFSAENAGNNYGVFAMESLVNGILKHGGRRSRLQVKVTGGGSIGSGSGTVGSSNIEFIQRFLKIEGFRPDVVDVGGFCPRKIRFNPSTGQLWVKKLASVRDPKLSEGERRYAENLRNKPSTGTVEIF